MEVFVVTVGFIFEGSEPRVVVLEQDILIAFLMDITDNFYVVYILTKHIHISFSII